MLSKKLKKWFQDPPAAKPGEINHTLFDRFTLVHFAIGVAYGLLGLGLWSTLALAIVWELIENPMKFHLPLIFPHGTKDTLQNSTGDSLAVMAGWFLSESFQVV